MDEFRKNYSLYFSVLCVTALWPYDESLLAKIQRIVFSVLTLCLIGIQMSTLKSVEVSLYNVLSVLSYTGPLLLYVIRYVSFVSNFSIIKVLFDSMENDWVVTKNPIETGIFLKHIIIAKRVIGTFVALACLIAAFTTATIVIPTLWHSKQQLYYLRLFGFFYNEGSRQTDLVCLHLVLITVIGVLSVASTESTIAVNCAYLCGLLEIASYRIENAVNNMVKSIKSEQIDVQSAVELHQRAIELVSLFKYLSNNSIHFIILLLRLLFVVHLLIVKTLEHYKFVNGG